MKKLKLFIISLLLVVATLSFSLVASMAATTETVYKMINSEYVIEDYSYAVKVRGPDGKLVAVKNGSVVLTSEGEYEIVYPDKTIKINVIKEAFDVQIDINSALQTSYSAGSIVTIPGATISCDKQDFDGYQVKILKDNELVKVLTCKTNQEKQYFINESGNYTVSYVVVDMAGISHSKNLNFTVTDVKEVYFNTLPQTASYGTSLNVGFPFGFYKGVNYAVEVKVLTPDGNEEIIKSPYYTLTRLGSYTFTYKSNIDGESITKTQTIVCANQETPFTFLKGNGVVSEANLPTNVFDTTKTKGMLVKSQDMTTTFFYNKIINVNNLAETTGSLLEFLPYSENGEYIYKFRVTLTDVYNPENKIGLLYQSSPDDPAHSHVIVEYKGITRAISNDPRDAVYGTIMKELGATIYNGSLRSDIVDKTRLFDLQYDVNEKQLNFFGRYKDYTYGKQIILDLDDPTHVGLENVFQGFTTGEVIVGFEFVNNNNGGLYVVSVGGENVVNSQVDASKLIVLADEDGQVLSGAKNYKFKLPNVKKSVLVSETEALNLTIKKANKDYTDLIKDGYFYPTEVGEYDFIYSTNYQGQIVEKTFKITINENPVPVVIADVDLIDLEYFAYNKLPEVQVSGGTGARSVVTSISCDGKQVEIVDGEFIYVASAKPYIVKVVATDSVGVVAEKTFELKLKEGAGIVLGGEIPSAIRKGQSVSLPSYIAYRVESGEMTTVNNVQIEVDGTLVSGNEFVAPTNKESINIAYKVDGETVKTATIKVLNVITDSASIFNSEITNTTVLESGVAFRYSASQAGKEVKLANKVAGKNVFIRLSVNNKFASFGAIKVVVSDTIDTSRTIVIRLSGYRAGEGKILVKLNDNTEGILLSGDKYTYGVNCGQAGADAIYTNSAYTTFEFYVDITDKAIKTSKGNKIIYLDNFTNGQEVGRFNNDVAIVSFALENVINEADLVIGGVSNQQFSYVIQKLGYEDNDNVGPELMIFGNDSSFKTTINQKYIIPRAIGVDVIQSSTFTKVTVEAPDGTKIINNKNADVEREIVLDKYGSYKITYTTTDNVGNKTIKRVSIGVEDETAPTITLNGNYKTEYALGEEISIVFSQASDNNSVVKEFIHLQNMNGLKIVEEGESVKLDVVGSYRIIYWAEDTFGNVERHVVAFNVK